MRGKRVKEEQIKKGKIFFLVIFIIIIIVIMKIVVDKSKKTNTNEVFNNNETNTQVIYKKEETTKTRLMANIDKTNLNKEIEDGEVFDSSISIYCNNGTIEKIIKENNIETNKKELTEDGNYTITVKPNDGTQQYSISIIIDTIMPVLKIDNYDIWEGEEYTVGSIIKLENTKSANKFSKALLIKCNENFTVTQEQVDITSAIQEEGYKINESGIYKIQLFNEEGNIIESEGSNLVFIIK